MPKVNVPQDDGEIVITAGRGEPVTYKVANGTVEVSDDDLSTFLLVVEGSTVAGAKSAAPKE